MVFKGKAAVLLGVPIKQANIYFATMVTSELFFFNGTRNSFLFVLGKLELGLLFPMHRPWLHL